MITDRSHAAEVTAADIRELITGHQRELNHLEFKASADSDLLKAACGIANAGGGFILIGIAEDAEHCASGIVNIEAVDSVSDSVRQRLRDGLAPRPVVEVVPLKVDAADVIVMRIAPQNPPHMVSQDKRTDFYGRYDATTERMRYEEIEQRFRDKHESGEIALPQTVRVVIETIGGRTSISQGANDARELYINRLRSSERATLALIAVSDENNGAVSEDDATAMVETQPLYTRQGGWQVVHDKIEVTNENGSWVQRLGDVSVTSINPSGDLSFIKPVDEVLCWRQQEADFLKSPRLYPNALAEYCLSFAYLLADIATRTKPKQMLVTAVLAGASGSNLPLGEGGTPWFESPLIPPNALTSNFAEGLPTLVSFGEATLISPRQIAFQLAAKIYSFFGYRGDQVAFASEGEITIESDPDAATLVSLRSYLQTTFRTPFSRPHQDFDTSVYWFRMQDLASRYLIGASEEFVDDHHWSEQKLFSLLNSFDIRSVVQQYAPDNYLLLTTEDGPRPVPRNG